MEYLSNRNPSTQHTFSSATLPSSPKSAFPTPFPRYSRSTKRSSSCGPEVSRTSQREMSRLTYMPGFPVHVEKLKKYMAMPTALPGASGLPEMASKVCA